MVYDKASRGALAYIALAGEILRQYAVKGSPADNLVGN